MASYGGDSDDEDDSADTEQGKVDESKLLDLTKMACLLCKRQFQNKESLLRHTQMSELHKVWFKLNRYTFRGDEMKKKMLIPPFLMSACLP